MPAFPEFPPEAQMSTVLVGQRSCSKKEGSWSDLQQQMDDLLDSGLSFMSGTSYLSAGSKHQLAEVAGLLGEHPQAGVAIIGYTAQPSGIWNTKALCELLALERASAVRDALKAVGCRSRIVVRGIGHVEANGARCEVVLCDDAALTRLEAEEAAAAAARKHLPLRVLRVEFDAGRSVKAVEFKKLPLGISFSNVMPSEVTKVEAGSQAEQLGVKVGWVFRSVNGQPLEGKDWPKLWALLEQGGALLRKA